MQSLLAIWAWIKANPVLCVMLLVMVSNVLFAQLPKPTTEKGLRIWTFFRTLLLVFSTHATDKGTFTWPTVLHWILDTLAPEPKDKPFIPVKKVDPDDTLEPPTTKPTGE